MVFRNTADVLYQGWDMEAMREAGDVANYAYTPSSPGFTAINQGPLQLISPPQSPTVPQAQQNQAKVRTAGKSSRRRNPTVAAYLGLGGAAEPMHLEKHTPTPAGQSLPRRTRKRQMQEHGEKATGQRRATTCSKKTAKQRHVSEVLCRTKGLNQSATYMSHGTQELLPTPPATIVPKATALVAEGPQSNQQGRVPHGTAVKRSNVLPVPKSSSNAPGPADSDNDFDQLCFNFEAGTHKTHDLAQSTCDSELQQSPALQYEEYDFDDDLMGDDLMDGGLMDDDLMEIATDAIDDSGTLRVQSTLPSKICNVDEPTHTKSTSGATVDTPIVFDEGISSSKRMSKKFISPVTLSTRLLAATDDEARKPIVRPSFPSPVRDRSPIIGLSSSTLLRTCFRVGEAINQSCQAVKTGNNILVELYARVLNSERDDVQQRFTFCDLFHARSPYIQAVYAVAIWKSVQLFEYDTARLLQQGRICRCIGTMKRDGKDWTMTILNIWEATWDDVQWVEGIVNS